MKNPLSYQSTEYDCGPVTMLNAMNYLFDRREISPDVVKSIMLYCLDGYNRKGEAYKNGTTRMAMLFLANWLNQFGKVRKWPIYCRQLEGREVNLSQGSQLSECLGQGGVVVARVMLGCWHYVLLTALDKEKVCLFDPYYRIKPFPEKEIELIRDQPTKMNRRLPIVLMEKEGKTNYALGKKADRECMLLFNQKTRRTMDSIEYII